MPVLHASEDPHALRARSNCVFYPYVCVINIIVVHLVTHTRVHAPFFLQEASRVGHLAAVFKIYNVAGGGDRSAVSTGTSWIHTMSCHRL